MARTFIAQLPLVPKADLVHGDRCGICREIYGTNITGSGIVPEDAVRLPSCGHEFGIKCLSTWLSPGTANNSCPLCRRELFRAAPAAEEEPALSRRNSEIMDIATELDAELSANGLVHRSRNFRDWMLYSQLQGQGANLPEWAPDSANPGPRLNPSEEEALFLELQRRGAFRVLPIPVSLVSERQIWAFLREQGYSYDAVYAATSGGCAWTQT